MAMLSSAPVLTVVLAASLVAFPSARADPGSPAVATPREGTYGLEWSKLPAVSVPERSQALPPFIDGAGDAHVFVTTNEGYGAPRTLRVVSSSEGRWSPVTNLGAYDYEVALPSDIVASSPTVAWTSGERVWVSRLVGSTWQSVSFSKPGQPDLPYLYVRAVATNTLGNTTVFLQGHGASKEDRRGWVVRWPLSSADVGITEVGAVPFDDVSIFWIANNGQVSTVYIENTGTYGVSELKTSTVRSGSWSTPLKLAQLNGFSLSYPTPLMGASVGDAVLIAWQQREPQFADRNQVWAASQVGEAWSTPELIADNAWLRGLETAGDDGPTCIKYRIASGPQYVREQVNGIWGSPLNIAYPGATARSSTSCLFARNYFDDEIGRANVVGVSGGGSFVTTAPDAPYESLTTAERGMAWTAGITGTSLIAQRLTFEPPSPAVSPSPPTSVRVKPSAGALRIAWLPPANVGGGSPLTYEYRVGRGPWKATASQAVLVRGQRGQRLVISVRAATPAGVSPAVTVSGVPR